MRRQPRQWSNSRCPSCDVKMLLQKNTHGYFYGCPNYPRCSFKQTADQYTGKPKGIPADKETRMARVSAHQKFDPIWRSGLLGRTSAYKLMQQIMGLPEGKCHISSFTKEQCEMLVQKLDELGYNEVGQDILLPHESEAPIAYKARKKSKKHGHEGPWRSERQRW